MLDPRPPAPPAEESPPKGHASILEVVGAVFWSFFGVRKGRAMRQDAVTVRPHQVIIVGVVAAALFVLTLLALVRVILTFAGA